MFIKAYFDIIENCNVAPNVVAGSEIFSVTTLKWEWWTSVKLNVLFDAVCILNFRLEFVYEYDVSSFGGLFRHQLWQYANVNVQKQGTSYVDHSTTGKMYIFIIMNFTILFKGVNRTCCFLNVSHIYHHPKLDFTNFLIKPTKYLGDMLISINSQRL